LVVSEFVEESGEDSLDEQLASNATTTATEIGNFVFISFRR